MVFEAVKKALDERYVEVTKIFKFDAAHWLPDYKGPCGNLHGHTWKLEVTIVGPVSPDGFVMDFSALKDMANTVVIAHLDHKCLNELLPNPTCENLIAWIWTALEEALAAIEEAANPDLEIGGSRLLFLESLRLWESDTSFATMRAVTEEMEM